MKLYGSYTSPFVRHCRVALLQTGLDSEFVETTGPDARNPSPTSRVPYLEDGELRLSDSTSILKHLRGKAGQPFLADAPELDRYCLANTVLDAAINVFLFEQLDGLLPEKSTYLQRQHKRVQSGLSELEAQCAPAGSELGDAALRLACLLDWGRYRNRFEVGFYPRLGAFLDTMQAWEPFAQTAPPKGAPIPTRL